MSHVASFAELRKAKGLTQRDIARALETSERIVSRWERKEGYPSHQYRPRLVEMLGVTVNDLEAIMGPEEATAYREILRQMIEGEAAYKAAHPD